MPIAHPSPPVPFCCDHPILLFPPINDEIHYRLLRVLDERPELSQRELARELGVSLGKTNYCLKALVDKGLVKVRNFGNNPNKLAYAYLLTPRGVEEKARITVRFLRRKMKEYEALRQEIEQLQREVATMKQEEA